MNKSGYKFTEKINKCDVIIKSTITKRTICRRKKKWLKQLKKTTKTEKKKWRKRESIDLFVLYNLQGVRERGRNEVRRNLYEN